MRGAIGNQKQEAQEAEVISLRAERHKRRLAELDRQVEECCQAHGFPHCYFCSEFGKCALHTATFEELGE